MDFEKHEEEIKKMLEPLKNKKPPATLMKDYENQVMDKIHAAESGPSFGVFPVLCFALVLGAGLVFGVYMYMKPAKQVEPTPVTEPTVVEVIKQDIVEEEVKFTVDYAGKDTATTESAEVTTSDEELYASLADDLFILEMLGEDDGLLDDFERIESDIDLWIQGSPAVVV